jgi:hypothetical protein
MNGDDVRLKQIGSRLTYANVMATGAMFVALGGGAYALSGVPDRSGVFHGCVAKSGALRVVAKASSCRKAKTVTRGKHRVRIPGESAIAWNQQGRPGVNGVNGVNGINGVGGATNVVVRTATIANANGGGREADCNPGERAVGGGVSRSDGGVNSGDVIHDSFPESVQGTGLPAPVGATPTAWRSDLSVAAGPAGMTFYVICASP